MCLACGGTCGASRSRSRMTIDIRTGRRTLRVADAGGPAPLFVSRPLLPESAADLRAWATRSGLADLVPANEMHVTLAYSRAPVDWFRFASWYATDELQIPAGGPRRMETFKGGVVVLRIVSEPLARRWREFREGGCSWDWPEYAPHITVAAGSGSADLSRLKAYTGPLRFGPEEFAPIKQ